MRGNFCKIKIISEGKLLKERVGSLILEVISCFNCR